MINKNYFLKHFVFALLPVLLIFILEIVIEDYEYSIIVLSFFHLIASIYFTIYIAERIKDGYSGLKLIVSIISSITWFNLTNAIYYYGYYMIDKSSFSNVPKTYKESIPEFIFFSIGNMFNNNITEIIAANLFTKTVIHLQMLLSFVILVLILSFVKEDPKINKI